MAALAVSVPEGGAAAGAVLSLGPEGGGAAGTALALSPLVADGGWVLADATTWLVFAVTGGGFGTLVTGEAVTCTGGAVEFVEGVAGWTEAELTPAP